MKLKLYAGPTTEPVTLAEVKLHLRIDHTEEDALLTGLVTAARQLLENDVRRALITQTWELVLDAFPGEGYLCLPRPPLQSVTSVTYTTQAGVATTFAASNYVVDTYTEPGRIVLKTGSSWPGETLKEAAGVVVRYVAGFGAASAVPQLFKQAIWLMVGHWYENREAVSERSAAELPQAYYRLMWSERVMEF